MSLTGFMYFPDYLFSSAYVRRPRVLGSARALEQTALGWGRGSALVSPVTWGPDLEDGVSGTMMPVITWCM